MHDQNNAEDDGEEASKSQTPALTHRPRDDEGRTDLHNTCHQCPDSYQVEQNQGRLTRPRKGQEAKDDTCTSFLRILSILFPISPFCYRDPVIALFENRVHR